MGRCIKLAIGLLNPTMLLYKVMNEGSSVPILKLLLSHSQCVQQPLPLARNVAALHG